MKEKQIEEMAEAIKSSLDNLGSGNHHFTGEEISTMFAEALYNANYRKQNEGRWEKPSMHSDIICSQCKRPPKMLFGVAPLYCPNCGAKMEGE